ncbi:MAG: triose-phosphate isomerase, partial [Pirellulales bacterium]
MRRPLIAGNWKMNLDRAGAVALAAAIAEKAPSLTHVDLAVFPPYVYIDAVRQAV